MNVPPTHPPVPPPYLSIYTPLLTHPPTHPPSPTVGKQRALDAVLYISHHEVRPTHPPTSFLSLSPPTYPTPSSQELIQTASFSSINSTTHPPTHLPYTVDGSIPLSPPRSHLPHYPPEKRGGGRLSLTSSSDCRGGSPHPTTTAGRWVGG